MPLITVSGTPIQFPDEASSPSWAEAVIQFCQVVANSINSVVGPYDVAPQQFVIDSYNPGSADIPNLAFSTSTVRAAYIRYSVYRTTNSTTVSETGQMIIVYNPNNPVGNKWEIAKDRVGDASISFSVDDTGQFSFTTTALSGINHSGNITFSAQALNQ